MTTAMNAPHSVTSISVPVDSVPGNTPIVQSVTGLKTPVYPAPRVYQVVSGQIQADPADVNYLIQGGFVVAGGPYDTTVPRTTANGSTVFSGQWPAY